MHHFLTGEGTFFFLTFSPSPPQNRKNDEASYEKMLKLRRDLSRAVTILEMIKRREKSKRELLHLTLEIVEKRYKSMENLDIFANCSCSFKESQY